MILLIEHDSGIDGWDARKDVVAVYDTMDRALADLEAAGYTFRDGTGFMTRYRHHLSSRRGMNEISYALDDDYPLNSYSFPHKDQDP